MGQTAEGQCRSLALPGTRILDNLDLVTRFTGARATRFTRGFLCNAAVAESASSTSNASTATGSDVGGFCAHVYRFSFRIISIIRLSRLTLVCTCHQAGAGVSTLMTPK
jgi:hypothetical protein